MLNGECPEVNSVLGMGKTLVDGPGEENELSGRDEVGVIGMY
jgi:hypothetical protein